MNKFKNALIVGVGDGLSASLARTFKSEGFDISLASRNPQHFQNLTKIVDAKAFKCDSSSHEEVKNMFIEIDKIEKIPNLVIYNPSSRIRGPIEELDPDATKKAIEITCFGAFLVAQQAVLRMKKMGFGSIFFTGASAGVKGFPNSSVFAMGKFGLRGLAQSLARELHPKNIHIGHFVIDGSISKNNSISNEKDDQLCPDEIAKRYLEFYYQKRSSWSWEIELRPWVENF